VKYYNEEDEDKIGPTLKRVVMWQLPEDNIVDKVFVSTLAILLYEMQLDQLP
jgi:hypothetical protein